MTNALIIARHHLLRIVRSPGLVLLLLAIPVTLAALEYAAFGPTIAAGKLPPITVLVLDEDRTFVSGGVPNLFTAGGPLKDMFRTTTVDSRDAARAMFERNDASALVIVPRGFQDALLRGAPAELQFAPNPLQTYSPEIAAAVLDVATIIGNGLYQQAAAPLRRITALRDSNQSPTGDDAAEIARGFFEAGRRLRGLGAVTNITVTTVRPTGEREGPGASPKAFFAFIFPGLIMFGVMFISQSLALRLLRDRVRGVERRLRMTPLSATAQMAGSFLFLIAGLFAIIILLMIVGAVIFRIELRNPLALAALAAGFAVFAAELQLTIIGATRDERSASFIGSGLILLLSLAGGTFFPAEQMPPFLFRVAQIVPNGAAQQGLIDVLAHGESFVEASGRMLTVWVWAVATMTAALILTRRRMVTR
jgi:ABC-type multidrug transport system permease subunit